MSRVYIGRLPHNAREKDIELFFRGFGRLRDINLKNGFGFVVRTNIDDVCVHQTSERERRVRLVLFFLIGVRKGS